MEGYKILWQMPTGQRLESAPLKDFLYIAILSTNSWQYMQYIRSEVKLKRCTMENMKYKMLKLTILKEIIFCSFQATF